MHEGCDCCCQGNCLINMCKQRTAAQGNRRKAAGQQKGAKRACFTTSHLCLPPGVDDRTPALAHHLKEPLPCARVDGLAHAAQDAQRRPVVLCHPLGTLRRVCHMLSHQYEGQDPLCNGENGLCDEKKMVHLLLEKLLWSGAFASPQHIGIQGGRAFSGTSAQFGNCAELPLKARPP